MPDLPLPLTFRSELIELIATSVAAGESCALVGVGSSGKSNVVRFLRDRADAREHYFGAAARRLLWLLVDCNALDAYDEPSLFRAMLEAMQAAVRGRSDLGSIAEDVAGLSRQAAAPGADTAAFRNLRRAVELLRTAGDFQCAFVLDDCDQLVAAAPPVLLRRLRALRDDFKYKIVYIAVTRRELVDLRPPSPEFEAYYEMMVVRSFAVGPYAEADARFMLDRLGARMPQPQALEPAAARRLISATGGHGGLLKAAYFVTRAGQDALQPDLVDLLTAHPSLVDECGKIWDSLDRRDHDGLLAAAAGKPVPAGARLPLLAKGLLHERTDDTHAVFCPVFENFVRRKADLPPQTVGQVDGRPPQSRQPEPRLEIYQGSRLVRVNGQDLPMTRAEFEILCRLYERRGLDCRREDLLERVLNAETAEPSLLGKTVDETLDRAAAELGRKLETNGFARPSVIPIPAGGYKMSGVAG